MTCDFVSSSSNRCRCLWCEPSPPGAYGELGRCPEVSAVLDVQAPPPPPEEQEGTEAA
jgi:hypothetical protein